MNGIDRNISHREVFVVVHLGRNIAAALFDTNLNVQAAARTDGRDVNVVREYLDIAVTLYIGTGDFTRTFFADLKRFRPLSVHFDRHLL